MISWTKICILPLCIFIITASTPIIGVAQNNKIATSEIIIGLESFPEVLNPVIKSGTLVFTIGAQVFAGLTRLDKQGNAIPYLAESWHVDDDGLRYTFILKQNAKFHDDTPITVDDIIFSVETSQQNHPFHPFLESIDSVQAVENMANKNIKNKSAVQIILKKPLPILPSLLIPVFVPILPKHVYGKIPLKDNPANLDIVGSGPFILESYKKNEYIQLIKNSHFFLDEQPNIDRILYKVFMDNYEMAYALGVGDVDIAVLYSTKEIDLFFQNFSRKKYNEYPLNYIYPYFMITYNYSKELFANPKVREAFSIAIDRKALVRYFLDSRVDSMYGPIPPESPFYSNVEHTYDVEKANRLLDEAGYKRNANGKRFTVMVDYLDYPLATSLLRWLQNEFSSKLGIELKTREIKDLTKREQMLIAGDFELFLDEVFAWHDPLIGTHRLYSSQNTGKEVLWTNIGYYENSDVDRLFDAVNRETNTKKRKELYAQLQEVLSQDYAALWLISNKYSLIAKKNIHNLGELPYSLMSPLLNVYATAE